MVAPRTDWNPVLRSEFERPYWQALQKFVESERSIGPVFPAEEHVFAAFHLTPLSSVKVVILGQDPYHGAGQAHGLCFSVQPPTPPPPSLRNIYAELSADLGMAPPPHGSLVSWAKNGVLLLNTTLTVRSGQAASHQRQGWETFTDQVISTVSAKTEPVVFLLWGSPARKKASLIDTSRHIILQSPHPSPLSAHRGFFGSKPFSGTNTALARVGREPMDWSLPEIPLLH